MAVIQGLQCDNCGKIAENGEPTNGWVRIALISPLPIPEGGEEPAVNSIAGEYHSAACLAKVLDKATKSDAKPRRKTKEVKKT